MYTRLLPAGRSMRAGLVAIVGLLACAAAMVIGSQSAAAYPGPSQCAVSSLATQISPGSSITLVGSGYPADTTVTFTLHSDEITLGSATTDGDGSFTATVDIPLNVGAGNHDIVASTPSESCTLALLGTDSNRIHRDRHSTDADSGLASTGVQIAALSTAAVVLLGGGVLLVVAGRRRRQS
jgi:hypothetical protein